MSIARGIVRLADGFMRITLDPLIERRLRKQRDEREKRQIAMMGYALAPYATYTSAPNASNVTVTWHAGPQGGNLSS